MGQTDYADNLLRNVLNWFRRLGNDISTTFQSGFDGGWLSWFSSNWLKLLIVLILAGIVIDWLVWMARWRPYWLWFRKKRVLLEDDEYDPYEEDDEYDEEYDDLMDSQDDSFDEFDEDTAPRFQSKALRRGRNVLDEYEDDEDEWPEDDEDDVDEFDDARIVKRPVRSRPTQKADDEFDAPEREDDSWDDEEIWGEEDHPAPAARRIGRLFSNLLGKKTEKDPEEDGFFEEDEDYDGDLFYVADEEAEDEDYEDEDSEDEQDDWDDYDFDGAISRERDESDYGSLSSLSIYERPTAPAAPVPKLSFEQESEQDEDAQDDAWHTGYTQKTPIINVNTRGLSRKTRRQLREMDGDDSIDE